MSNVIKFQKPKPEKAPKSGPPKWRPPRIGRPLAIVIILALFAAAWAYFQFVEPQLGGSIPGASL
ncbi:hypothetical protein [Rhizobium sp. CSW-27]|uniref:hypothetical protein n=1 Tax=Rhizobium sp. CSW-27 TaxID=2839985 RepID=UPI001C009DDE|nr:hypothetical protein [Rhizobium sp. CSW-27]MBT9370098.1 hypothetical protein [Rhizobium sp. CSW-27]